MNPKIKAALYVLYSILGAFALFGLIALTIITELGCFVVAGILTAAMLYGAYRAFYEIFKD